MNKGEILLENIDYTKWQQQSSPPYNTSYNVKVL